MPVDVTRLGRAVQTAQPLRLQADDLVFARRAMARSVTPRPL